MKMKTLQVRMSEEMYESLLKDCGEVPVSQYVRKVLDARYRPVCGSSQQPEKVQPSKTEKIHAAKKALGSFKTAESIDQFGFKRNLAKPGGKK